MHVQSLSLNKLLRLGNLTMTGSIGIAKQSLRMSALPFSRLNIRTIVIVIH